MATMKTKSAQQRTPKEKTDSIPETASTHEHVGVILRRAREERDITIDMVADELMIRRFYLDVLEKGAFDDLPERVYATGFVKNYANYLGLDSRAMVEQFKRDAYGSRHAAPYQVTLNMPEPVAQSVVPNRSAIIAALVVLAVLIAGVIWMTRGDKAMIDTIPEPVAVDSNAAADIPVPSSAAVATPAVSSEATDIAAPSTDDEAANETTADENTSVTTDDAVQNDTPAVPTGFIGGETSATNASAAPAAPVAQAETAVQENGNAATVTNANQDGVSAALANVKNHRVLEAVQASWVEVRDEKNAILFTSILKKGQILPLPDGARLSVTTGNAGGLRMLIDGKPQPVFGQMNEVKRNMVIAPRPLDRH